jgi:hypothetical protein
MYRALKYRIACSRPRRTPYPDGYNTFGNCGHFAPHGSFILPARFFAQSAVISSSQSISLAFRPRRSIKASAGFGLGHADADAYPYALI